MERESINFLIVLLIIGVSNDSQSDSTIDTILFTKNFLLFFKKYNFPFTEIKLTSNPEDEISLFSKKNRLFKYLNNFSDISFFGSSINNKYKNIYLKKQILWQKLQNQTIREKLHSEKENPVKHKNLITNTIGKKEVVRTEVRVENKKIFIIFF